MMTYDPLAISLFAVSWTTGMAAMMFPAITPTVLLYGRFVTGMESGGALENGSRAVYEKGRPRPLFASSLKIALFIGSYLCLGGNRHWPASRLVSHYEWHDNARWQPSTRFRHIRYSFGCSRCLPVYSIKESVHRILRISPELFYAQMEGWDIRRGRNGTLARNVLSGLLLAIFPAHGCA